MKPWKVMASIGLVLGACSQTEPRKAAQAPRVRVNAALAPTATQAAESTLPSPEPANSEPANPEPASAEPVEQPQERTPDVVYVPTPQPVVDRMLELAQVKKNDLVYDLGCGDGRIVVTAAKRYGTRAIGFDIDPARIAEARQNVKDSGVEDLVTIEQKDIFKLDLRPANVVTLYLLPQLNVKLIPQLEKMKPGSRIVSHDFDMAGVEPVVHLTIKPPGTDREHEVFLWRTPLQKTGSQAKAL